MARRTPSLVFALALLMGICPLAAQSPPASAGEKSLGDVARENRRKAASAPKARKTLDEEGRVPAGFKRVERDSCNTIPCAKLSALVPEQAGIVTQADPYTLAVPLERSRLLITCGLRDFPYAYAHVSLAEAETLYLGHLRGLIGASGSPQSSAGGEIDGHASRETTFTTAGPRTQLQGTAVFVEAPAQVLTIACVYHTAEFAAGEAICRDVVRSIQVKTPEDYKLWEEIYRTRREP